MRLHPGLLAIVTVAVILNLLSPVVSLAEPNFTTPNFKAKWQRADKAVAEGAANPPRSWLWGPEAFSPAGGGPTEPYAESPGGVRQVQYFDKARMELNNPANGLVTNGLLVRELISGRLATGNQAAIQRRVAGDIPVAGDPLGNVGPTYASFGAVASLNLDKPAQPRIGAPVNETIDRAGQVGNSATLGGLTKYVFFEPTLKHNIPEVFWLFMNARGNVFQNGQYVANGPVLGDNPAAPWLDAVGLPLTEAYWAKVTLGGSVKDVLIQNFERRVLTYTPSNPAAFQVEMGNVGRHYFRWRYDARYDLPTRPALTGVNLAGAEFTPRSLPGQLGTEYAYPTTGEVDYFMSKGLNTFRLPFAWERLQPGLNGALKAEELAQIDNFVSYATGKGAIVILDPHNYARYYGKTIGSSEVPAGAFADLWGKLAARYKDNSRVVFGLMNEPVSIPTQLWVEVSNGAIKAIRGAGATNLVLVAGSSTTEAYSWNQVWHYTPYGQTMLKINDPANNYAYEFHQYLDGDSSGTSPNCVSPTVGAERLQDFTRWLKQHNQRGFLGEFGGGRNDTCYAALDGMLTVLDRNADVWLGWSYWAAGPLWGDYIFTLEPAGGNDRPQLAVLSKHLAGSPTVIPPPPPFSTGPDPVIVPDVTSPTPTPTPTPAPVNAPGSLKVEYTVPSHWENGYNISVTIANSGAAPVEGWTISWQLAHGETLTGNWNAACSVSGSLITCTNMPYNAGIGAGGGSQNFGAQFNTTGGRYTQPTSFTVNGETVTKQAQILRKVEQ